MLESLQTPFQPSTGTGLFNQRYKTNRGNSLGHKVKKKIVFNWEYRRNLGRQDIIIIARTGLRCQRSHSPDLAKTARRVAIRTTSGGKSTSFLLSQKAGSATLLWNLYSKFHWDLLNHLQSIYHRYPSTSIRAAAHSLPYCTPHIYLPNTLFALSGSAVPFLATLFPSWWHWWTLGWSHQCSGLSYTVVEVVKAPRPHVWQGKLCNAKHLPTSLVQ